MNYIGFFILGAMEQNAISQNRLGAVSSGALDRLDSSGCTATEANLLDADS